MSPTSYQAAPPRITFEAKKVPHARRSVKCHRRRAIGAGAIGGGGGPTPPTPSCPHAVYPRMKTCGGTGS